jgi:exodeoxyribonuclease VII small subunit
MAPNMASPGDDEGFDAVLARLRKVVERLETGNLSLEESLAAYEEGVGLAKKGHGLLDGAEKRVELLIAGGSQSVPLDEAATDDPP